MLPEPLVPRSGPETDVGGLDGSLRWNRHCLCV
jgi:hypothetical protein